MIFDAPVGYTDLPAAADHLGGARAMPPRLIVLHATVGSDSRNWLSKTSTPPVSIHRLISKSGLIYRIVPDDRVAWHAGFAVVGPYASNDARPGGVNEISLGIELENRTGMKGFAGQDPYPPAQLNACARQIVSWWGRYGFLPLVSHALIDARKSDPAGLDWADLYRRIWAVLSAFVRGGV
jgi:N-acetyl-anhydromuramyl-L-alanine amidase AmpD